MAKQPRLDYPNAIQYVCIKGISSEALFRNADDFDYLGQVLAETSALYNLKLMGFCLLPNQAHAIFQTDRGNIVEVMHRICTKYTLYYNRTYHRAGPLMRGRFLSTIIQPDEHLLRLSRWLHLLPTRELAQNNQDNRHRLSALRRFQRSSYRAYADLSSEPRPWLNQELIRELCARFSPCSYSRYVRQAIMSKDLAFDFLMSRPQAVIGTPRFVREVTARCQEAADLQAASALDDDTDHLAVNTLSPFVVIRAVCRVCQVHPEDIRRRQRGTSLRPLTTWALSRFTNLSQSEIAQELSLSTSAAISTQLRAVNQALGKDKELTRLHKKLDTTLLTLLDKVSQPPGII